MKRKSDEIDSIDDLRPEYDFDALGPAVVGKYAARLAELDLSATWPSEPAGGRALIETSAFEKSAELLLRLHDLTATGEAESPEAEDIRDEMEAPWNALAPLETRRINRLSGDLHSLNGRGREGDDTTALHSIPALWRDQDFDALLDVLQRCGALLAPDHLASARAFLWKILSGPEVAVRFDAYAWKLAPRNPVHQLRLVSDLLDLAPVDVLDLAPAGGPEVRALAEAMLAAPDTLPEYKVGAALVVNRHLADTAPDNARRETLLATLETLDCGPDERTQPQADMLAGIIRSELARTGSNTPAPSETETRAKLVTLERPFRHAAKAPPLLAA